MIITLQDQLPPSLDLPNPIVSILVLLLPTSLRLCTLSPTPLPGGDKDMDFDIEKTTGSIVIARPLDTRRRSSYNLTVEVTDGSQTIATQVRSLTGSPE